MELSANQISAAPGRQPVRTGGGGDNAEAALQRQIRELDRTIKEIKKEIQDNPSKKDELARKLDETQETKRALEQQLRELKRQNAQSGGAAREPAETGAAQSADPANDAGGEKSGVETALRVLRHARKEDVYVPGGEPEADNVYRAVRREDGAAGLAFDRAAGGTDRDGDGKADGEDAPV